MPSPRFRLLAWCALVLGTYLAAATHMSGQSAPAPGAALRWYKGNTHTHTLNSDGDSTPDDVVRWYREHGYQFLVLTDHNFITSVDGLNALHGADEQFLVIRGEEVTSKVGDKPIHVNGLAVQRRVEPATGSSVGEVLQRAVDGIRSASGVPHINHPNFGWAITGQELQQVRNNRLFEIFNGHPQVNQEGGGGVPGLEEVWDRILTSGTLLYGIAVDDAHHFKQPGNPLASGPGRGWVVIRAARLESDALLAALESGNFYASTGVVLDDVVATPTALTVRVKPDGSSKYRIRFIGRGGQVLREATDPTATYTFTGDEGYVRAKVLESNGRAAWVQPVTVARKTALATGGVWLAVAAMGVFVLARRQGRSSTDAK
ncbi:MAG: CehA/McbA family metallohydrolase [Vicinamibacteraceae bacterium]